MNACELEVYWELIRMCNISDTISGLMFGCSRVYLKYEKDLSRYNCLSRYRFHRILKTIKKNGNDEEGNLEFFIKIFLDKEYFKSFNRFNEYSIEMYGKVSERYRNLEKILEPKKAPENSEERFDDLWE